MLSKDIQDKRRSIQHPDIPPQRFLKLTLVARRQLIIEDNDVNVKFPNPGTYFLYLASSNKSRRIDPGNALVSLTNNMQTSRVGQQRQFVQRLLGWQQRPTPFDLQAN
jgi:hypothetical protein